MKIANGWAAEYQSALRDYLSGSGETALHRAYELGRKAIEQQLSILDVTAIQHEILAELIAEGRPIDARWQIERMTEFFVESLSPFEMTQRGYQEANAKLLRWKHVFEHAGWGIAICSREGQRLDVMNPAFAEMHGYAAEQLAGRPLEEITAREARAMLAAQLRRVFETGHGAFDSLHLRKDGSTFSASVDATAVPSPEGDVLYLAINLQDMTERKRYEEALELAKSQTELANRELEAFSYSVAHDLRSPLRAISGFSRMVLEDHAAQLDEEARHKLTIVVDQASRMGVLIDDLLEFSRTGRGPLDSSLFDLDPLVKDVIRELLERHAGRKIDIQVAPLGQVRGDRALLRQVFVNLIGNAVKYTGKRDVARIEIGTSSDTREKILWVKDNGAGFDMKYADRLFGVFQRLHTNREFEGTGIGLALVARIVQRHGGRVWAEGAVDRGATMSFTLPVGGTAGTRSN